MGFDDHMSVALAGGSAAGAATVIMQPIEILKCRAQFNRVEYIQYRKATMELVAQYGYRGIYRGYWPLFWRDVPAWSVYFWAYDFLKHHFVKNEGTSWRKTVKLIVSAGVAGQLSWIVSYPMDVIKCVI